MELKDVSVKIIKCEQKQGTSKAGRPYNMFVLEVVDESFNKFQVTVPRANLVEGVVPEWIIEAKNLDVFMDFEIVPRGYGVVLNAVEIRAE